MKTTIVLIFNLFVLTVLAQNKSEKIFLELIRANSYEILDSSQSYYGTGMDWLVKEGANAQYFMVGETHGTAEVPQICGSIFTGLSKNGYNHAALEISPFAAQRADQILRQGGYDTLKKYLSSSLGYNSSSFLGWNEEAQLAALIVEKSKVKTDAIWGLDQEFMFGFTSYLDFLKSQSETEKQKMAVHNMQLKLKSNEMLFINLDADTLKAFTELFKKHSNQKIKDLIQGLEDSHYIYGPWARPARISGAESNVVRENLIKKNFLAYNKEYRNQGLPKVFFKFGGFHSAPAVNKINGTITLGTFIEEFALLNDVSAFNLFIECYGGTKKTSGQDKENNGGEKSCKSAYGDIDSAKLFNQEGVHPFNNFLGNSNKIFLVDLRPLRLRMNEFDFLNDDMRALIAGFDAYMALPGVTQSETLNLKE